MKKTDGCFKVLKLALFAISVIAGCGRDSISVPSASVPSASRLTLSGTATQGLLVGSVIRVFPVNPDGTNGTPLGQTETDSRGNFTVGLGSVPTGPVRITASGGAFVSEQNGAKIGKPSEISMLLSSASANISGISINPLTEFVNSLTVGKLETPGTAFTLALVGATTTIENYYSLKSDPATLFPNYTAGAISTDAGKLGLVVGALINEDQHLCPSQPGGLVSALSADISDGVFDGMSLGKLVPYCGGSLEAIAGTSAFQDALSGVQQLQLITAGFVFGGAGNALTANGVAPAQLLPSLATINPSVALAAPPSVSSFATTPPINMPGQNFSTILLPNGKVLVFGGFEVFHVTLVGLASTALYDPTTNSRAAGPSMNSGRTNVTATLLPNGKVLIAGGLNSSSAGPSFILDRTTELYDPVTNSFAASTPSMNVARYLATATLLPNGKVLIAGGFGGLGNIAHDLHSTELYDPVTNSFAASTPSMNVARAFATATLLPNGKVLITGDLDSELYDPVSKGFSVVATPLFVSPYSATLLANGKVFIQNVSGGAAAIFTP